MAIVPFPLPPAVEARTLLHHLLEHGDIVGRDTAGRTIIQLPVDDWALEHHEEADQHEHPGRQRHQEAGAEPERETDRLEISSTIWLSHVSNSQMQR